MMIISFFFIDSKLTPVAATDNAKLLSSSAYHCFAQVGGNEGLIQSGKPGRWTLYRHLTMCLILVDWPFCPCGSLRNS